MRASLLLVSLAACSTDTFVGGDAAGGDGGAESGPPCVASFCASAKATTCDDFDMTTNKWVDDPTNNGSITVGSTQSNSTSCPNALQVVLPAMSAPLG
ncbi:MAG TPA: hypothetical protein VGH87_31005, partial [Polyangiaceae bacterium]